ncbi:MAG: hypothetical protein KDA80_10780, partial [Planctomycetaceae bacterium]|nr:hypothetical protein [Planctomycetaceae bacterium]
LRELKSIFQENGWPWGTKLTSAKMQDFIDAGLVAITEGKRGNNSTMTVYVLAGAWLSSSGQPATGSDSEI